MRLVRTMATLLLPMALAGCFLSEQPLLTDANSVAPYQTIAFRDEHAPADTVLMRSGTAYAGQTNDGMVVLRLMPADRPNWYVVQVGGPGVANGSAVFYAAVRFDAANHRAYAYKSIGSQADVAPGLRLCGDAICVDDLGEYTASAEASADSGHLPDATYIVTVQ